MKSHSILSRGLLFFWATWFSVVFSSNLADGLQQAGLLSMEWRFVSGNFGLIGQSIEIYPVPESLAAVLFAAVVLVQLGTVILFWLAALDPETVSTPHSPKLIQAFLFGIGLFAAFLVADELFVVYDRLPGLETTHLLVLGVLLLSYLVIYVLSDHKQSH